ncbi:hypothetical protein FACS189441_4720 [Betaproteobacteria bacterium]|nr:hypothetical protein FACS189441_4720 [Betaproteobacteria bacterium]
MTAPATRFFLTRNAARDLRKIYARSRREWGEEIAERYLADLYTVMEQAAITPKAGRLRQQRAAPFLMVPARQHFVIYEPVPEGIAILTIQHQVRDIESLMAEFTASFHAEIERLKHSFRKGG